MNKQLARVVNNSSELLLYKGLLVLPSKANKKVKATQVINIFIDIIIFNFPLNMYQHKYLIHSLLLQNEQYAYVQRLYTSPQVYVEIHLCVLD